MNQTSWQESGLVNTVNSQSLIVLHNINLPCVSKLNASEVLIIIS